MKTQKLKSQKPIDLDVNFKYQCPNKDCGYDHWLSLKETQTKNFKVVCDCGTVFKPKRISKLKILYTKTPKIVKQEAVVEKTITPPVDLLESCAKILVSYGFTKNESLMMINKAYNQSKISTASLLIKHILQHLGELNNGN